ncbi:rrp41 [Symbiodinium microadriaticum]|nr:rrp41 [Symbiodinium microadriaticum]
MSKVGTPDEGYELHPRMRAREGEIVVCGLVDKWTYGAFASTYLERELRARGVRRILLCGVLTNVCVFATASQAVDRFIPVCLVEDACAAFQTDWHQKALTLINEPQTQPGHKRGCGLYFGEVTQVEKVEAALKDIKRSLQLYESDAGFSSGEILLMATQSLRLIQEAFKAAKWGANMCQPWLVASCGLPHPSRGRCRIVVLAGKQRTSAWLHTRVEQVDAFGLHFVVQRRRVGAVPNAAGSAYVEQGNTKIIASVYGPRQAERDRQQARAEGLLAVEVLFAPFCTREFNREENEKREILYKSLLQGALESVILLERYAKTAFDITLLILEDDGAVLTSCLAAAAMALADARVEMRDLVAGATVHLLPESGRLLLDCDREEERSLPEGSSVLHLGLCPRRGHLCLLHSVGPLPPGPFEQMRARVTASLAQASCLEPERLHVMGTARANAHCLSMTQRKARRLPSTLATLTGAGLSSQAAHAFASPVRSSVQASIHMAPPRQLSFCKGLPCFQQTSARTASQLAAVGPGHVF